MFRAFFADTDHCRITLRQWISTSADAPVATISANIAIERMFYEELFNYNTVPKGGRGNMKKGIDISAYQTNVDYAHTGVDFTILRAGYGKASSQKDKMFDTHYNGFKAAGVPIGAYWYSYAMTEDEARQEAKACIECLKGKQFEYPIYYDVEEDKQYKLGKKTVSAIIKAFCDELEKAGYWVGIYTNTSWYNTVIDSSIKNRYALWIAHWNVSKPGITDEYGLWQYKVGKQQGVAGDCDLDYGYIDYPTLIKKAGKNGYSKSKKSIDISVTLDGITYSGTLNEA